MIGALTAEVIKITINLFCYPSTISVTRGKSFKLAKKLDDF